MTKDDYIETLDPAELARHKHLLKAGFKMLKVIHPNTKYVYTLDRIEVDVKKPAARFKIYSAYSKPRYTNLAIEDIVGITKFFMTCGSGQRLTYEFVKKVDT